MSASTMKKTKKRGRVGGREASVPRSPRGRELLALIESRGLTITTAADKARLPFRTLFNAVHGDPGRISAETVAALCGPLGLPLSIVAPQIAKAIADNT